MKERNSDICVVVGMDEDQGTLTVYSPIEDNNIIVNVTDDILADVQTEDALAFEVDLDTKEIV